VPDPRHERFGDVRDMLPLVRLHPEAQVRPQAVQRVPDDEAHSSLPDVGPPELRPRGCRAARGPARDRQEGRHSISVRGMRHSTGETSCGSSQSDHGSWQQRDPVITTYILLWGSIREPFMKKILGDDEYLWSYTKGFSELPSPAQLKASLAEQLSVEQLRDEFRQYIKTKVAQELIDFYLDSLDREEVMGFFERQVGAVASCDRPRKASPRRVSPRPQVRQSMLALCSHERARAEVLVVMETNFQREFVTTEGFRRIADASEVEHREIRLLRAGGMLPSASPSPASPLSPVSPMHPSRLLSALRSLPLVRRLRSTAPLSAAAAAAEHGAAVVRDTAADGDGGGGASAARSSSCVVDGGSKLAGGKPPRRSGDPSATGSKSTSLLGIPEMGVVEEEEAFNSDLRGGLTTPIYGGARGDGRGRAAISTPSRGDGYTTDGGDGPDPLGSFGTPVNEDGDGFRTPVSRHSRMLL
ncbi:unnamed protein product, partial [Ectocarpus sp. 12 AP-2014]